MKGILLAVILSGIAPNLFADNYNSISVQGQLNPATPIYGVTVDILSGGQVVGSGSNVDLIPDSNGIFSANTLIADPKIFLTGSDFVMRLSTGTSPITVLSTFSVTAAPFALTIRGDVQDNNQNVFGAYGNVGIGTDAPAYRLVVSSAGNNLMWVSSDGVHSTKFHGDGSALSGIVGAGDSLGTHIATMTLNMNGNSIFSAGDISATSYQITGSTVLAVLSGVGSLGVGVNAGRINTGGSNLFVGDSAGYSNTSGWGNTFLGQGAGQLNTGGIGNSLVGKTAGDSITTGFENTVMGLMTGTSLTTGIDNSFYGSYAGFYNTGSNNTFLGFMAGYSNTTGSSNIVIGDGQDLSSPTVSNELNIGGILFGDLESKSVGIGLRPQQGALEVASTGTLNTQFAQIWRDSGGVIKASMSATGVMMSSKFIGDGSGLTGVSAMGDNLGDHTATRALDMAGSQLMNVSSITVTGSDSAGYSLSLSSGIYMPAGTVNAGVFLGSGTALTDLNASNIISGTVSDVRLSANVSLLNATQTVSGQNTFTNSLTISSFTVITSATINNLTVGYDTTAGNIRSGVYTPIIIKTYGSTPITLTARQAQWMRTGNVVTISGCFTLQPGSAGYTELSLTIPTDGGSGNFDSPYDGQGILNCWQMNKGGGVYSLPGTRVMSAGFFPADTSSRDWQYVYTYSVH